ncbi:MAG TPA: type II toxin-antitoxin system HicA family toxin [Patescibacteria group bacterium]|nr:type II toxin-antitoxin system HicA family toxin [Patescibacteria group bacterium]
MSNISPLPYRDVIKKLRKLGFVFRRATGGSHEIWWNERTKKTCVVPHHREIKTGTLRSIIRQAGVAEKDFINTK